jgi:cytoskeleton protein RodZ
MRPSSVPDRPEDHDRSPVPRGNGVGDLLRTTRESYDLTLSEVAGVLRIRQEYLAALEENDPRALPAPAYVTGFLRVYAQYLGLDAEEIVRRLKREKADLSVVPELNFPVPLTERGIPGGSVIVVALLVCAVFYGAWNWYASAPRGTVALVEPVPARLLPPPSLDPPTVSPASAAAAEPRPTAPLPAAVPTVPAPAAPPPVQVASVQPAAPPATDPIAPPAGDHVFGSAVQGKLVVKATGDAWVEVLDNDHPIWSRLLKSGDVYNPPKDGLTMIVGNAGGIEVQVNGKTLPPIGAAGEVRHIALDPAKLGG